jgi:hypothetical protein
LGRPRTARYGAAVERDVRGRTVPVASQATRFKSTVHAPKDRAAAPEAVAAAVDAPVKGNGWGF